MFASEYGWSKEYILDQVYPDEYIILGEEISKRKINGLIMELNIAHNPHREDGQALADMLMEKHRELYGSKIEYAPLDKEAFEQLRAMVKKDSLGINTK